MMKRKSSSKKKKKMLPKNIRMLIKEEILRDGETKTFERAGTLQRDDSFTQFNCLSGIPVGTQPGCRLGAKVHLTGVRLQYQATMPAGSGPIPSKWEIYLIRTEQADPGYVASHWFQSPINENGVSFTSVGILSSFSQITTRKHTGKETFQIIGHHSFDLFPTNSGVGKAAEAGVVYWKIPNGGEEITFRDNPFQGAANGTVAVDSQVLPRYEIFAYTSRQDNSAPTGITWLGNFNLRSIAYFKDA